VNGTYGISFSYPRIYSLQATNDHADMPVEASFVKPGAVEIASLDMPDGAYPETDFSSALLNVTVNPAMTAAECGQFAPTSKGDDSEKPANGDGPALTDAAPLKPTTVKLGTNEFSEIDQMERTGERQSDLKYFHLFNNGACYEFALDLVTVKKADTDLAEVDRAKVFSQLEKILRSARIRQVDLPMVEKSDQANISRPAETTEQTEKTRTVPGDEN
jgi:hypothetical protein